MKNFIFTMFVIGIIGTLVPVGLHLFHKGSVEINNITNIPVKGNRDKKTSRMERIQYYKDEKTNLCFAYFEDFPTPVALSGLAHVPCENLDEVILFKSKGINHVP